jgi:hypothetical protein
MGLAGYSSYHGAKPNSSTWPDEMQRRVRGTRENYRTAVIVHDRARCNDVRNGRACCSAACGMTLLT